MHYLDGNGYKEIEANSELQKENANKRLLQSVKVSRSGKVENSASELQIGKKGKIFLENIEHTKFELVSETISSFVVGGISLCEN